VRVIAGSAKGVRLTRVPPGTRPLSDMAREGLFASLAGLVDGARCLDLYAGTGAGGIEALSRGAERVTFVDRSAAESLHGVELFVSRAALPATAKDEYYHADLIGLRAEDSEGRGLGTVQAIHNYGAGDIIEIARADGDSILLPFTRETVPTIEIDKSRIVIAVPEDVETGERGNVE